MNCQGVKTMHAPPFRRNELGLVQTTRPVTPDELIHYAGDLLCADLRQRRSLKDPAEVREFLRLRVANQPREVFGVAFLDNRHRLLHFEIMFQGTISSTTVHPREIARRALELNAAAVILTHNHPSNDPEPSMLDYEITRRISDTLALVDVRIIDHLVMCRDSSVSLSDRGWRDGSLHKSPD